MTEDENVFEALLPLFHKLIFESEDLPVEDAQLLYDTVTLWRLYS